MIALLLIVCVYVIVRLKKDSMLAASFVSLMVSVVLIALGLLTGLLPKGQFHEFARVYLSAMFIGLIVIDLVVTALHKKFLIKNAPS